MSEKKPNLADATQSFSGSSPTEAIKAQDTEPQPRSDTDKFRQLPVDFGEYRVLEKIGQGGMGVVYRAFEQKLNRTVALKMLNGHQGESSVSLERFQKEAKSAASLDHPNVVPIHDIGTIDGEWYFTMSFVEGPSLAERIAESPFPAKQAAELIRVIADAVQTAHSQGVIHRDIKPANILLDGNEVPKITDFGLAKWIVGDDELTISGQIIGTPSYASPEQASDSTTVSEQSDVYSLGATLYCALTGRPPFRSANPVETLRQVNDDAPVPPRVLNPDVPADLETITLKCLEKDPLRRYTSAGELSADLQRWLDGKPIVAKPPSLIERSTKWVKRHPARGALVAAIVIGLLGTSVGMIWALDERSRANQAAEQATRSAELARVRETTTKNVLTYMIDMFEAAGPEKANGDPMTVDEFLGIGVARIDELNDEPEVQAELLETIGYLYVVLSKFEEAEPLLLRALEYREANPGRNQIELASALHAMASLYQWTGDFDQVKDLEFRALDIWDANPGNELAAAQSLNVLGNAFQREGDLEEAEAIYLDALDLFEQHSPNAADAALVMHNLGIVRFFANDLETAEELYERVIEIETKTLGTNSHHLATTQHVLAIVNTFQGKLESALRWQLEAQAIREKVLPEDHDHVALSAVSLGNIHREMNRLQDAETNIRRGLNIHLEIYDTSNGELWWDKQCLVWTLIELRRFEEARKELDEFTQWVTAADSRYDMADANLIRAELEAATGDYAQAKIHTAESIALLEQDQIGDDTLFVSALMQLAEIEAHQGNLAQADEAFQRANQMVIRMAANTDYRTLKREVRFVEALAANDAIEQATPIAESIKTRYLAIADREDADLFLVDRAARFLLECPVDSVHDPALGQQLARRVVDESVAPSAHYLATLAMAQSQSNDAQQAVETQQQAIDLLSVDSFWRADFSQALESYRAQLEN